MFENEPRLKPRKSNIDGCEIKVKRDNAGRVTGVKTNGKCTKTELEIFKEQNGFSELKGDFD